MAIDANERKAMAAGRTLTAKYKGAQYTAEVVAGEESKLRYRLGDGRQFKSSSAASSAVMGGAACNGWRFWSIEGEQPADTPTPPRAARQAGAQTPDAATKPRPQCLRCGKTFVGATQLAHHEANADRLCTPA